MDDDVKARLDEFEDRLNLMRDWIWQMRDWVGNSLERQEQRLRDLQGLPRD